MAWSDGKLGFLGCGDPACHDAESRLGSAAAAADPVDTDWMQLVP